MVRFICRIVLRLIVLVFHSAHNNNTNNPISPATIWSSSKRVSYSPRSMLSYRRFYFYYKCESSLHTPLLKCDSSYTPPLKCESLPQLTQTAYPLPLALLKWIKKRKKVTNNYSFVVNGQKP